MLQGAIVGLGNPGPKYEGTRHNTGFLFIDSLLKDAQQVRYEGSNKFSCELWRASLYEAEWLIAKPLTFMNLSGQCVQPLLAWHRLSAEQLIVVHDELDLPPGSLRFKCGGGNAGHNGLKSISQQLGSSDFNRLRIGIGKPVEREEVINWVLRRPPLEEAELWTKAIDAGRKVIEAFARRGLDSAIRTANAQTKQILQA